MPKKNNGPRLTWRKSRKKWYIAWSENSRNFERSTNTECRKEANEIYAEFLHNWRRRSHPHEAENVSIVVTVQDYLEEHAPTVRDPVRIGYGAIPIIEYFQDFSAAQVTPQMCREYCKWRNKSSGTMRRELGILQASLNHAFKERRLNQQIPVTLPSKAAPKERWLSKNEADNLLEAASLARDAKHYLPLFIRLALYTARRKEAILSLRWCQVDFANKIIDFRRPGELETNKRRGIIPIPAAIFHDLQSASKFGSPMCYIISKDDGKQFKDIKGSFKAACKRAGLEGVTPHVLKHTAITWMLQAGVNIYDVSRFTSTTTSTIEKVYGHHALDHLQSAANAVS